MREAGHTLVEVEPQLQALSGEAFDRKTANKEADARSDIKCCGFWSNKRQAFFDVKVVSPFARSYFKMSPALFRMAERAKIREYRERILEVEQSTGLHLRRRNGPPMPSRAETLVRTAQ